MHRYLTWRDVECLEVCHSSPVGGYHNDVKNAHKFCSLDTIGKPFIKTPMCLTSLVTGAREKVEFEVGKSFL